MSRRETYDGFGAGALREATERQWIVPDMVKYTKNHPTLFTPADATDPTYSLIMLFDGDANSVATVHQATGAVNLWTRTATGSVADDLLQRMHQEFDTLMRGVLATPAYTAGGHGAYDEEESDDESDDSQEEEEVKSKRHAHSSGAVEKPAKSTKAHASAVVAKSHAPPHAPPSDLVEKPAKPVKESAGAGNKPPHAKPRKRRVTRTPNGSDCVLL
jgi:hypothetical protein